MTAVDSDSYTSTAAATTKTKRPAFAPADRKPLMKGSDLLPYLLPATVIIVWQFLSSIGWISGRIMPAPWDVLQAFWATTISGDLPHDIAVS